MHVENPVAQSGDVDAVAIVPPDGNTYIERGEQIPIRVLLGEIDPVGNRGEAIGSDIALEMYEKATQKKLLDEEK